jgi:hypothetical protein
MQTENVAGLVRLTRWGRHVKLCLFSNPGPFPFGAPKTMGKAQYIGIANHLVLTLMEDRYLAGLLAFQADVPMTPSGQTIHWCGGVACHPYQGDIYYKLHTLFVRDVVQLMAGQRELQLAALISGISGRISDRQYWLIEVPSLTREVLLNLDEIVVVRRRGQWAPSSNVSSKVARGEFWQCAGFREHPLYEARRPREENS